MGTFPYDFFWCHIIDFPTFFQFKQKKQQVIHTVPVDNLLLLKISNCRTVNEFRFSATRPDENYRSKALWSDWHPDHSGQC